jgi:hypothetical protein
MTFHISSALASQAASKTAVLEILQELGYIFSNLRPVHWQFIHKFTYIEYWELGVKVWARSITRVTDKFFYKGFSTIISWKKIALRLWDKAKEKALNLTSRRISETRIKVEGQQAPGGWWTVTATQSGLECNCHLYRCEHNRLVRDGECQPLFKAIFSNKGQIKEFFNEESGQLEPEVQICCHHIIAAMWNEFDAENLSDYLLNYAEITNAWKQRNRSWGKLSFNVPAPKPEIPIGSYLQRTEDWMSLEYRVWIHCRKTRLEEGEIPWTTKGIGRIVEQDNGTIAYRPNSGIGQVFATKYDAIAYLIRNAGYTTEQVAQAFQLKQSA